ncbi:Glycosyltransferase involved in cell wall bisynthesis [Bryocella elongata]|uniref:Glycosyltransferase involved in cell wall bisynthesis n=2 Tax=Bryocella elongata TaxID=863522 RepID=A0A1H5Y9L9_9BACT|nr:Glycosyltransferase involved in cell wall bisynthesis [Bryocella elongata]
MYELVPPEAMDVAADSAPWSVTAVVAVYNGARFLRAAIESILNQTRPVDEIIVVDDGSQDDSAEIARSYPNVQVLTQPNMGVVRSRNRGITDATSTWIAFLDQDDVWLPDKMERQIAGLQANPVAEVCMCGFQILIDGKPGEIRRAPENFARSLEHGCLALPSGTVARKSALVRVGGFHVDAAKAEDWDLLVRLKRSGTIFMSFPEPLMLYRRHGANVTNDPAHIYTGDLEVFDRLILPGIAAPLRPLARWRRVSMLEGDRSILEREQGQPHLTRMLRSLAMWPFGNGKRYRIAAHMVLRRLGAVGDDSIPPSAN